MNVLELEGLTVRFGGLTAVNRVDLTVPEGEIVSIIGPNGAGKTTVFNAVTGIYEATEGNVRFCGRSLVKPFGPRVAVRVAGIGLAVALLSISAFHLLPLWEAAITANYRFMEPFPWGKAAGDALGVLGNHLGSVILCLLAGGGLGAAGGLVVWRRQRRMPDAIAKQGICRTFQNIRLFQEMTVLENVITGMDMHLCSRLWQMLVRSPRFRKEEREAAAQGLELLRFVGLAERAGQSARSLPYGDQRRLEIARALATRPRILLLDEPAAGMNPTETSALMTLIAAIRDRGVTVLLIEHHMKVVMGISDRIAVLDYGIKIAEGTPAQVRANPRVIEAYLGKDHIE